MIMCRRDVGATLLGLVAGSTSFVVLLLAGLLLYRRLWGDSTFALVVIVLFFGAVGLYAGWILGMLVFSAVRDKIDEGKNAI